MKDLKLIVTDTAFIYRQADSKDVVYKFEFSDVDRQLTLIDPNGGRLRFYLKRVDDERMEWGSEYNYTVRWIR